MQGEIPAAARGATPSLHEASCGAVGGKTVRRRAQKVTRSEAPGLSDCGGGTEGETMEKRFHGPYRGGAQRRLKRSDCLAVQRAE
ncbi:hypothetical protein NDU88_000834 [Pleurodeles waltl]|uniref:Uncharacterized protein n=1 Tax=Pleurodeles waltl TaxID=8319 RepID=A0AAV7U4N4_PLEWA|nr:hypothetical protein NDU88_000834 [Pleurodeles waltl]